MAFGSAHADGFSMVTCDGAVHRMSYNIDPDVHRRYGDCRDKTPGRPHAVEQVGSALGQKAPGRVFTG